MQNLLYMLRYRPQKLIHIGGLLKNNIYGNDKYQAQQLVKVTAHVLHTLKM